MKTSTLLLAFILVLTLTPTSSAYADDKHGGEAFARGLEAYDGGDYLDAVLLWHRAAQKGHLDAMTSLADMLYRGLGTPTDIGGAMWWYNLAARMGDPIARMVLAEFAAEGVGGTRDLVKAYIWVGLAAEQGYPWAVQQRHVYARGMDSKALRTADQLISRGILPSN